MMHIRRWQFDGQNTFNIERDQFLYVCWVQSVLFCQCLDAIGWRYQSHSVLKTSMPAITKSLRLET